MTKHIIKEIRLAKGLEQKEFAKILGVSKTTVCNWETGYKKISAKNIKKILAYCEQNNIKVFWGEIK